MHDDGLPFWIDSLNGDATGSCSQTFLPIRKKNVKQKRCKQRRQLEIRDAMKPEERRGPAFEVKVVVMAFGAKQRRIGASLRISEDRHFFQIIILRDLASSADSRIEQAGISESNTKISATKVAVQYDPSDIGWLLHRIARMDKIPGYCKIRSS